MVYQCLPGALLRWSGLGVSRGWMTFCNICLLLPKVNQHSQGNQVVKTSTILLKKTSRSFIWLGFFWFVCLVFFNFCNLSLNCGCT